MKILHVIESLDLGGAEKVLLNIIKNNTDKNIEHAILCLSQKGEMAAQFEALKIKTFCCFKKTGFDYRLIFKIQPVLAEYQPDLLHTHLFTGNLWGRLASVVFGIPCVISVQNADTWIKGWRRYAEKLLVSVPKATIGASSTALEFRKSFGLDMSKTQMVRNGSCLLPANKTRSEIRQEWQLNEDVFVVGTLARCVPQKNVELFIKIAEKLCDRYKDICFIWSGGGELLEGFKKTYNTEGSRIKFIGHQEHSADILSGFDLLLSTSHREGLSLSLIEGMLSALPLAVSNVDGNKELMLETLPEAMVLENTVECFEKMLCELIEAPEKAKILGARFKEKAEEFLTAETMSQKYCAIYQGLSL
jgi:glycosyltransferase involved in cell wall biosynthesis